MNKFLDLPEEKKKPKKKKKKPVVKQEPEKNENHRNLSEFRNIEEAIDWCLN